MEPNNFPREVIGKMSPMVGDGATFPEKLIRPFILATSKENDLVLDPFIGSGTTAKVSRWRMEGNVSDTTFHLSL